MKKFNKPEVISLEFDNLVEEIRNNKFAKDEDYINDKAEVDEYNFVSEINKLVELTNKFDRTNSQLSMLFGVDSTAENEFFNHFYNMRHKAIEYLSRLYGDDDYGWIEWYLDEVVNSRSGDGLECNINGKEYLCKTGYDLYKIIKLSKNIS